MSQLDPSLLWVVVLSDGWEGLDEDDLP